MIVSPPDAHYSPLPGKSPEEEADFTAVTALLVPISSSVPQKGLTVGPVSVMHEAYICSQLIYVSSMPYLTCDM